MVAVAPASVAAVAAMLVAATVLMATSSGLLRGAEAVYTCANTTDPYCASYASKIPTDPGHAYAIGDAMIVKVAVLLAYNYPPPANDTNATDPLPPPPPRPTYSSVFYPTVDKFSLLRVPSTGVYMRMNASTSVPGRVQVRVAGSTHYTCFRQFGDTRHFNAFMTAVVTLESGVVSGVKWADGCGVQAGEQGINATCGGSCFASYTTTSYQSVNDCASATDDNDCQIRVYVIFTGTDSKNIFLKSAEYNPANFINTFGVDTGQWSSTVASEGASVSNEIGKQKIPTSNPIPLPPVPNVPNPV